MVKPSLRSGKRKLQKSITGVYTIRKAKKKTRYAKCALCGTKLAGVPRGTRVEIRRLKKSQRSPSRPFGGQLCSTCTRKKIIAATRNN